MEPSIHVRHLTYFLYIAGGEKNKKFSMFFAQSRKEAEMVTHFVMISRAVGTSLL